MPVIPPREVKPGANFPEQVDVVVIGGGIIGASAALSLAEKGVKVAICEKGAIAAEQSCRNWGWTRQMGRDPAEIPLIIRSIQLWSEMRERVGEDVGFRRTGATYLCRTEKQLAEYETWMPYAREYDLNSKLLGKSDLIPIVGNAASKYVGALHTATDGKAEPHLSAPLMAEAAQRQGACVLAPCAVRSIETSAGNVCGVITERGEIACDRVILAGGSWSRLFLGNLGIPFPQLQVLISAARLTAPDDPVPTAPMGDHEFSVRGRMDGGFTLGRRSITPAPITADNFRLFCAFAPMLLESWKELRFRIDRGFISSWRVPRHWQSDEVTPFERVRILDPRPVSKLNQQALDYLIRAFPAFRQSSISDEWAGYIDVTPDAVPVIGPVAQLPGLYVATGFSGHGFGTGPGAGEMIAEMAQGQTPTVNPEPFRFERFGKA